MQPLRQCFIRLVEENCNRIFKTYTQVHKLHNPKWNCRGFFYYLVANYCRSRCLSETWKPQISSGAGFRPWWCSARALQQPVLFFFVAFSRASDMHFSRGFTSGDWLGYCTPFHFFAMKKVSGIRLRYAFSSLSICISKCRQIGCEGFGCIWADYTALQGNQFHRLSYCTCSCHKIRCNASGREQLLPFFIDFSSHHSGAGWSLLGFFFFFFGKVQSCFLFLSCTCKPSVFALVIPSLDSLNFLIRIQLPPGGWSWFGRRGQPSSAMHWRSDVPIHVKFKPFGVPELILSF